MSGDFTLGTGTEAYFACSTILNGETFVFGGMKEPNQVFSIKCIAQNWLIFNIVFSG